MKITDETLMEPGKLYCAFRTVTDTMGHTYDRGDELIWCGTDGLYTEDGEEYQCGPLYDADGTCVSDGADYPDFFVEQMGSSNPDYAAKS